MTNHIVDLKNADVSLVMGSNMAANHPISMKWVGEGRRVRGTKLIHVDPRYTSTSSLADLYAPLRSGTDIPFISGMINYILQTVLFLDQILLTYNSKYKLNC